jgi:PKD repeat protein
MCINRIKIIYFILLLLVFSKEGSSQAFKPTDISGVIFWLSADSNVVLNSNNVESWLDLSPLSNNFGQSDNDMQPELVPQILELNNKPALRFDGINDFLISDPLQTGISFTGFIVLRPTSVSNNPYPVILNKGEINTEWLLFFNSGPDLIWRGLNGDISTSLDPFNKPYLIGFSIDDNLSRLYIDTAFKNQTSTSVQPDNITPIYVGSNGSSFLFEGDIAEIIFYDRLLTTEERKFIEEYLRYKYAPPVNLGEDINMSNLCDTILSAGAHFKSYEWSTGEVTQSIIVNSQKKYWVTTTDFFGFSSTDTVEVNYFLNQLKPNHIICLGDSLIWDTGLDSNYSFNWSDGSSDTKISITQAGKYWVTVSDHFGCSFTSDTILVEIDNYRDVVTLGSDTSFCAGNTISLFQGAEKTVSYLWSNNSEEAEIVISASGVYWVEVVNGNGCKANDSIFVNILGQVPEIDFTVGNVCLGDTVYFSSETAEIIEEWLWEFGTGDISFISNPLYLYGTPGDYEVSLSVVDENGCSNKIKKSIKVYSLPVAGFTVGQKTCEGKNIELIDNSISSEGVIINWEWRIVDSIFQTPEIVYQFLNQGSYFISLKILTDNDCSASHEKVINVFPSEACMDLNNIPGLRLWFSADSGIVLNGNRVESWSNLSGSGLNCEQTNPNKQPELIPQVVELNNNPVLRFDGINDFMYTPPLQIGESFTGFVVFHPTSVVNSAFPVILNKGVINTEWLLFFDSGSNLIFRGLDGEISQKVQNFNKATLVTFSIANTTSKLYIDTVFISQVNVSPQPNNNTPLYIGSDGGSFVFEGDIAEIILFNEKFEDSNRQQVETYLRYKYAPPVNLGPNILSQNFCDTVIRAGKRFQSFEWFYGGNSIPGANADSIIVTKPGKYWVDVVDIFGFTSSDTIEVIYPPFNQLAGNQIICLDDSLEWRSDLDNSFSFLWNSNSSSDKIYLKEQGRYWVDITKDGCNFTSDTVTVIIDSYSQIASLGPDTALCSGNELFLKQGADLAQSYLWSDNSTGELLVVTDPGVYHVAVTNINGCIARDTIEVTIKGIAPDVDFNFRNVCKDQPMQLFDSTDPMGSTIVEYLWEIDNSIYQSKDISHIFNQSGFFDVKLVVTTANGCKDEAVKQVTVYALPDPDFLFSSACSGQSVEFIDNSFDPVGIEAWSWNFNNPTSGSENTSLDKDPQHIFDSPGDYNVKLIVTSGIGCIDSVFKIVNVKETPSSDFTFENRCFGLPIEFEPVSSSGVAAYNWEFGDGRNSQFVSGSHFYEYWGSYQAALTVFGTNGCNASTSKNVSVYELASIMFSPLNACIGVPVEFTDQSQTDTDAIVSWAWTFENDGSVYSDQSEVVYTFNDLGVRKVKLEVLTENGCESGASIDVVVHALPLSAFTIMPSVIVPDYPVYFNNFSNGSQNYFWDFGDGNSSIEFEPTHVFDNAGAHIITLNAVSQFGCENSFSRNINIIPANLDIAVNNIIVNNRNGYLEIIAELINYGSVEVSDLELFLELKNGRRLKEKWQGSFGSGQRMLYSFNSELVSLRNDPLDYVCVSARNSFHHKDSNPLNNDFCKLINDEDIILFDPNPNPVKDDLLIRFFLPRAEDTKLEIYSSDGKIIAENLAVSINKGLNQVIYRTSDLNQGLYLIKLTTSSGRIFVKRFLKN